jgi:hypothetical protein
LLPVVAEDRERYCAEVGYDREEGPLFKYRLIALALNYGEGVGGRVAEVNDLFIFKDPVDVD